MTSKRKNNNYLWIGATLGFVTGICGNLVAAWIQQDVWKDSFTPLRLGLIVLCTLMGIIIVVNLEKKQNMTAVKEKARSKNVYLKIKLAWSRFRTRGQGIHVEDVSAMGSDIDIDAK